MVSSIWAGASKGYKSLLWARIIQGVAVCPFEALVNASVGDMYCVHQRGKRMAVTNFALFGGAFMTPVVVGKMTSTIGWRWSFYFVAIFAGLVLPLVSISYFTPHPNDRELMNIRSSFSSLRLLSAAPPTITSTSRPPPPHLRSSLELAPPNGPQLTRTSPSISCKSPLIKKKPQFMAKKMIKPYLRSVMDWSKGWRYSTAVKQTIVFGNLSSDRLC